MGKTDVDRKVKESFFCPLCGTRKILPPNDNSKKQNADSNPGGDSKFARHLTQNSVGLCLCQIFTDNPVAFSRDFD